MIRAAPDVGLIAVSQMTPYGHLNHFYHRLQARPRPLWVKSRHVQRNSACKYLARRSFGPKGYVAIGNVTEESGTSEFHQVHVWHSQLFLRARPGQPPLCETRFRPRP